MKYTDYKHSKEELQNLREFAKERITALYEHAGRKENTLHENIDHAMRQTFADVAMFVLENNELAKLSITGNPEDKTLAMTLSVFNVAVQSFHGTTRASIKSDFTGSRQYILCVEKAMDVVSQKHPTFVTDTLYEVYVIIKNFIRDNVDGDTKAYAYESLEKIYEVFYVILMRSDDRFSA